MVSPAVQGLTLTLVTGMRVRIAPGITSVSGAKLNISLTRSELKKAQVYRGPLSIFLDPNASRWCSDLMQETEVIPGAILNKGFTLIEILVVLLIVGITTGFALMAFGDFGEKRSIIVAAEQFTQYVKLVQQQAILETSTLGINITDNGYQVLRFKSPASWSSMPMKSIFHRQHFPKGLVIGLKNTNHKRGIPAIIINSSGDMTEFTLDFGTAKQPSIAMITGQRNGTITLQRIKSP